MTQTQTTSPMPYNNSIIAMNQEIVNYLNSITEDEENRSNTPSILTDVVDKYNAVFRAIAIRNKHRKPWHMKPGAIVEQSDGCLVGLFPIKNKINMVAAVARTHKQIVDGLADLYECAQFTDASIAIEGKLLEVDPEVSVSQFIVDAFVPKRKVLDTFPATSVIMEAPDTQEPKTEAQEMLRELPSMNSSHPEIAEAALEQALDFRPAQLMDGLFTADKNEDKVIYITRLLKHYFGDELWYDELKQVLRFRGGAVVTESDLKQIAFNIQLKTSEGFSLDTFCTYAYHYGRNKSRNSFKDYIESLPVDAKPEQSLNKLYDFLGFDNGLERVVFTKFLIGILARQYNPGCPMDWLPIFQGSQGIGKSLLMRVLMCSDRGLAKDGTLPFLDLFLDHEVQSQDKDTYAAMTKFVLVELSEFDDWQKKMTSGGMKRFISRETDVYRKPYDRELGEHPRSQVLMGTLNPAEFLNDPSGSRRFFIYRLRTKKGSRWFDKRALARMVPSVWAAARTLYRQAMSSYCPENAWLLSDIQDEVENHNQANLAEHPLDAKLDKFLAKKGGEPFTKDDVLIDLGLDDTHANSGDSRIIGNKLHELGFVKDKFRYKGRNANFYFHPDLFELKTKTVLVTGTEEDDEQELM